MSGYRPPRWLERLCEAALPPGLSGQGTLGDLAEEFERRALSSAIRARLWYAGQTVSILVYRLLSGSGAESARGSSSFLMDLRWSFRSMLRHPGFSLGVVGVLGLGLGANTAVYSVVDGTLQNTSWWAAPEQTVAIWPSKQFSYGQLGVYQDETTAYEVVGGYTELAFALRGADGESQSVTGVLITPALFRELAVQPGLGRALADEDAILGAEPVVVIGEALWRRSFGADPSIIGRQIDVGGGSVTVVGVQGASGEAPGGRAEVWLPLVMDPRDDDYWKSQPYTFIGRLRAGTGLDDAFADLDAFTNRLSRLFPMFYEQGWADGDAHVAWADETQRRMISTPLLLLLAGTGLLLIVTALNVGNLLLGRAVERRRELAVRTSLGAGRGRVVSQLLVEGLVFTVAALALGLVTGSFGGEWVARLFVEEPTVSRSSILSPSVLTFGVGVSALAWVVLNGVPVAYFLRTHGSGVSIVRESGATLQRGLVSVQAALATLLLVVASLLVATVGNLRSVPLGFDPGGVVAVELSPPADRVEELADARALYDRLTERVSGLPGVEAVGLTGWLPLRADAPSTPINLRSDPVDQRQAPRAPMHMVDPGFFDAIDVRPLEGRLLGIEDQGDVPGAVVVNKTLADMLWPDGLALGQQIAIDPHAWDRWTTVVGVIPDVRSGGMTGPIGPALYVALAESPSRDLTLMVRTSRDGAGVITELTRTVAEVDALVPIRSVTWMEDVVRAAYSTSWVMMGLLIVLAGLASVLGAIGIYAVLAHHVALNRREIGVRMALGAQPGAVVGGVVRSGLILSGVGILVGCLVAALSTRLVESLLFGVSSLAPWAFVAPALTLALAAAVAAWVPAARAGRLPPAEVLRSD